MTKTFKVEKLKCANCAAKIEKAIQALNGVRSCSVNFITGKLFLDADDANFQDIVAQAGKIVARIEVGASLK
ncbi:MAG: heavy-metal-associated domain-containing protein [Clostridiales bacterium]|jgi:copper chaperone CopZ|nr:heavy-metal-associated domain-containing protein [Clostridiales bacterium]